MKRILKTIIIMFIMSLLLAGCNLSNKEEQFERESEILTIQVYQQMVSQIIQNIYIETGVIPSDEEIEQNYPKSLKDMNISIIRNTDGSITISNANPKFTKNEIPDVTIKKEEFSL